MARDFTKDTANRMSLGTGGLGSLLNGASAVSFSAIVTLDTITSGSNNNRVINWVINAATAGGYLAVHNGTSAVVRVGARSSVADGFQTANGTTVLSTGTEYQIGGVVDYANDRVRVYVNGAREANATVTFAATSYTHGTPTAVDSISGDNIPPSSTSPQVDGRISEVCIWSGDIGDDGFAQLGDRISAVLVRPNLIVDYLPLMGANSPERGWFGLLSGTITGTVAKADHPRIILPRGSRTRKLVTATGGAKTGTGTATTAAATSSGAARVIHKPTGTPNATAPAATSSGAGLLEHSGTGAATAPAATSSGAGRLVHPATGTATAPAATTDGDGRVVHGATGAGAAGAVSASGTGRLVHGASGTATAGACASSGAASVVGTQTGTGSATCGAVSSDGAGRVVHRGTGAATCGAATSSGEARGPGAVDHGGYGGFPHGAAKKRPPLSPLRSQPPRRAPSYAHANAVALALLLLED